MTIIHIDDQAFVVDFQGFQRPLRVPLDGTSMLWPPWSCDRHLDALRRNLHVNGDKLELNAAGYASDVLRFANVPADQQARFFPLALWWAHGEPLDGDGAPPPCDESGWVRLSSTVRARVRPWTWGERLRAQQAHLTDDASLQFDLVGYLRAMLNASVDVLDTVGSYSPATFGELDAGATRTLIAAVVAANHRRSGAPVTGDVLDSLSPTMAATTLRLCSALGWTPSQVMSLPSAEVERLLGLLDTAGAQAFGAGRNQSVRSPSIADCPDAVIINFGEDPT